MTSPLSKRPPRRAFIKNIDVSPPYRIPGIIGQQDYYFRHLPYSAGEQGNNKICGKLDGYLRNIAENLKKAGISAQHLTLKSKSALFNIQGLQYLQLDQDSQYVRIYHLIQSEKNQYPRYVNHRLQLQFSPSRRLYHSLKIFRDRLLMKLSISSLALPEEYFELLAGDLLARIAGTPRDRHQRDRLIGLEKMMPARTDEKPNRPVIPGNHYHLAGIFQNLNRQYFQGQLSLPLLTWSPKTSRRRLGYYDRHRNLMVISRVLDHPDIPEFVIRGIVYHEMLHMLHPIQNHNGRRIIHSRNFKKDERKFAEYDKLHTWLKLEYPRYLGKKTRTIHRRAWF